jgi:hypothetical protein
MKVILSLCLSLLAGMLFSQSVTFTPEWKKGDKYELYIRTAEASWEKDSLVEETSYYVDPLLEVVNASKKSYTLRVTFTDIYLQTLEKLQQRFDYEPDPLNLELIYHINREDGSFELINIEEARQFIKSSMDELSIEMKNSLEDDANQELVDLLLGMVIKQFDSDEMISSFFDSNLNNIMAYYYQPLSTEKTIVREEKGENPFSPGDSLSITMRYQLSNYDTDKGIAEINSETIMDMSEYMAMVTPMIRGMIEGFAKMDSTATQEEIDQATAKFEREMEGLSIESTIESKAVMDIKTTWLRSITTHTRIDMNMGPMGMERKESITETSFTRVE